MCFTKLFVHWYIVAIAPTSCQNSQPILEDLPTVRKDNEIAAYPDGRVNPDTPELKPLPISNIQDELPTHIGVR